MEANKFVVSIGGCVLKQVFDFEYKCMQLYLKNI
jgi:hypothetical protein